MIRFLFNFILFGLLFYALWVFFPDAFNKLTSWAAGLFTYISDFVERVTHDLNKKPETVPTAPAILWYLVNHFK